MGRNRKKENALEGKNKVEEEGIFEDMMMMIHSPLKDAVSTTGVTHQLTGW